MFLKIFPMKFFRTFPTSVLPYTTDFKIAPATMACYNTHLAGWRAVSFCRMLLLPPWSKLACSPSRGMRKPIRASLGQGGSNYNFTDVLNKLAAPSVPPFIRPNKVAIMQAASAICKGTESKTLCYLFVKNV